MADKKQNLVKYGEVVAKCWEDEAYKKRFIEDPESVLTEAGYAVAEGVTYKVIEQPKLVKYLVLPCEGAKEGVQFITKRLLEEVEKKKSIIPEGTEVRIIQNTEDTCYLVLPVSPKTLSKAELSMAAGGDSIPTAVMMPTQIVAQQVGPVVEGATVITQVVECGQVEPTVVCVLMGVIVAI